LPQAPQWALSLSSITQPASPQNHCPGAQGAAPAVPPEELLASAVVAVVVEDAPPLLVLPVVSLVIVEVPGSGAGGGAVPPLQAATSTAADTGTIDWLRRRMERETPRSPSLMPAMPPMITNSERNHDVAFS
jgi:hypothetical protein